MTLGEFRKATEHLADNWELERTTSGSDIEYTYDIETLCIKVRGATEDSKESSLSIVLI